MGKGGGVVMKILIGKVGGCVNHSPVPGRGLTSLIQIPVWYQPTRIYPVTNLVYKREGGRGCTVPIRWTHQKTREKQNRSKFQQEFIFIILVIA
jgi:hypothetical protein